MKIFAKFSADGLRADISYTQWPGDPVPDGAVEIDAATRDAFLAGGKRWNGTTLEDYVAPSTQINFLAFMSLFTPAEQAAIVNSTDPRIKLFCLMAAGAAYVDLTDARVVSGTQLLEALGLIGAGRATQVLAGKASAA